MAESVVKATVRGIVSEVLDDEVFIRVLESYDHVWMWKEADGPVPKVGTQLLIEWDIDLRKDFEWVGPVSPSKQFEQRIALKQLWAFLDMLLESGITLDEVQVKRFESDIGFFVEVRGFKYEVTALFNWFNLVLPSRSR